MLGVPCPPVIDQELFDELTDHRNELPPMIFADNGFPVVPHTGGTAGGVMLHETPPPGVMVKVLEQELVQPLLLVIVTVYVPAVFSVTHCEVAPVLQR
jgi:hypothetical protein